MMDDVRINSLGEFALIDRIARILGPSPAIVGTGDDTAVLEIPGPDYLLATIDMLIEGVHFQRSQEGETVGARAYQVNASDIASMGGTPTYGLLSLALPPDVQVKFVDGFVSGLRQAAREHNAYIIGGNLTRTAGPLAIDVALLGRVPKRELVRRSGAREHDVLAVTGTLGDAAAARLSTAKGMTCAEQGFGAWLESYSVPTARVEEARRLAGAHLVHAMLDLSDGLASDVRHLTSASHVGAIIDRSALPISAYTLQAADGLDLDPVELALSGGEDYELLIALDSADVRDAQSLLGVPLTPIGRVVAGEGSILLRRPDGSLHPLAATGWTHF